MSFLYASFLWLLLPLIVYVIKRNKSQNFVQNLRWAILFLLIVALALLLFFFSATRFSKKLLALFVFMGLNLQAEELIRAETTSSWHLLDDYYLVKAYALYEKKAYKASQESIYKLNSRGLEARLLLAHTFYKQGKYKVAKSLLKGIKSTNKKLKQQLYYELGNCEAQMSYGKKAKDYYVKALQLGEDADALANLEWVVLHLKEESSKVGYSNPSSAQVSNKNSVDKLEEDEMNDEKSSFKNQKEKGTSGSSSGKKSKNSTVKIMKSERQNNPKRTFSSKAYDLINEGYIREDKPW